MNENAYTSQDLLRLAQRVNNTRRKYLLVNPLQAKHMPVSPGVAHTMMHTLGEKIKTLCGEKDKLLIIGFAETATAIGAVVAQCLGGKSVYIHTTREKVAKCSNYYTFLEEHSHAVDQSLCADNFRALLSEVDTIILVEDEISTGKTIYNMIRELVLKVPEINRAHFIAASLINRMGEADQRRFLDQGIHTVSLLSITHDSYDTQVASIKTGAIMDCKKANAQLLPSVLSIDGKIDPRMGVHMGCYHEACISLAKQILFAKEFIPISQAKVLVLGTEECMYPALIAGLFLEQTYPDITVKCHATTRSPIAVSTDCGYPIVEGYALNSFYDPERDVFLYNLDYYDFVILITDAPDAPKSSRFDPPLESLVQALGFHGYGSFSCIRWKE